MAEQDEEVVHERQVGEQEAGYELEDAGYEPEDAVPYVVMEEDDAVDALHSFVEVVVDVVGLHMAEHLGEVLRNLVQPLVVGVLKL